MTDVIGATKRGLKKGKYKVSYEGPLYNSNPTIQIKDPNGDFTYIYKFVDMY